MSEKQPPVPLTTLAEELPKSEVLKGTSRYKKLSKIIETKNGVIWRAFDKLFGKLESDKKYTRVVCLKELTNLSAEPTEKAEQILAHWREFQLMARVSELSPHIQRVYDYYIDDSGNPVIVLELNRGQDLNELIKDFRDGLPTKDVIRMLTQLAGAIDIANAHGVIHGDIKPENILEENDIFKITDFGISPQVVDRSTRPLWGTPLFIPPETILAEHDDEQLELADVYALAVVTYNCLCKKLHIREKRDSIDTAFAVVKEESTPITEQPVFRRRMREEGLNGPKIEAVLKKALARDPQERYQTAQEFAEAMIEALTDVLPVSPKISNLQKIQIAIHKVLFGPSF